MLNLLGINQSAPGSAVVVYPNTNNKSERPHILVSGDGSTNAYLFEPDQNGPINYNLIWTETFGGIVGGIGAADIDGDGWLEYAIPAYDKDYVSFYTFSP